MQPFFILSLKIYIFHFQPVCNQDCCSKCKWTWSNFRVKKKDPVQLLTVSFFSQIWIILFLSDETCHSEEPVGRYKTIYTTKKCQIIKEDLTIYPLHLPYKNVNKWQQKDGERIKKNQISNSDTYLFQSVAIKVFFYIYKVLYSTLYLFHVVFL